MFAVALLQGPLSSYFFGGAELLVLDAMRDFAPGEELLMSYGNRDSHKMLQFAGFISEDQPGVDNFVIEAAMSGVDTDPWFKLRCVCWFLACIRAFVACLLGCF